MRSTDLFSIFLLEQWTMLRLRSTCLLSIPPTDPLLQFPMLQGAKRLPGRSVRWWEMVLSLFLILGMIQVAPAMPGNYGWLVLSFADSVILRL